MLKSVLFRRYDASRCEIALRIGLASFLSYVLVISEPSALVPPAFSFLPGAVAPVLAFSLPHVMFSIGAVMPMVAGLFVLCSVAWTALLHAAAVSDGLLCVIYTIYCIFTSGLFFGKDYSKTSGTAPALMAMPGLITLSFRQLAAEGGHDIVNKFWTESGTENPLAVNRNLLIALYWGLACAVIGIIVPPFRTMRMALSRVVVPSALNQAVKAMGEILRHEDGTSDEDTLRSLTSYWNLLEGGKRAKITLFEPRILRAPFEKSLVEPLTNLCVTTECILKISIKLLIARKLSEVEAEQENTPKAVEILNACAKALKENDERGLVKLQGTTEEANMAVDDLDLVSPSHYLLLAAQNVLDATTTWLSDLNHPKPASGGTKDKIKSLVMRLLPWLLVSMGPLKRIFEIFLLPFKPRQWNIWSVLWALRYVSGLVALFVMSVYWEGFSNFAIETGSHHISAVFSGWALSSYAFSWSPTIEGTINKGLHRLIGTCAGAFAAWLGTIICSGSYENDLPDINPYALVTYLTVVVTVSSGTFGIDPGIGAYFGSNKTRGVTVKYLISVMSLISLEIYFGLGSRDELVINRMVATLAGVAMSMLIQMIPPHVRGSDSSHVATYCQSLMAVLETLIRTFLKEPEKVLEEGFGESLFQDASSKREAADFLLKDTSGLKRLSSHFGVLKVDPSLRGLIDDMGAEESMLDGMLTVGIELVEAGEHKVSASGEGLQERLERVLEALESGSDPIKPGEEADEKNKEVLASVDILLSGQPMQRMSLLVLDAELVYERLKEHEVKIKQLE